jgi:hypothetical protein
MTRWQWLGLEGHDTDGVEAWGAIGEVAPVVAQGEALGGVDCAWAHGVVENGDGVEKGTTAPEG